MRLSPARLISSCPAHEVTPAASSASLTTKSDAMKRTAGSPNPCSAWSRSRTPVAQSESETPIATIATGRLSQMKTTTVAASTRKVIVMSLMRQARGWRESRYPEWTGAPGPSGMPIRYQATKNSVHRMDRNTTYGIISETTVPIPAFF